MSSFDIRWRIFGGRLLRAVIGRRQLSRIGRYLLNAGRMDEINDMRLNGELRLAAQAIQIARTDGHKPIVLDVGANVGAYSHAVAIIANNDVTILAIEPCTSTFASLSASLSSLTGTVIPIRAACSDHEGIGALEVVADRAGTNFLTSCNTHPSNSVESVALITVDQIAVMYNLGSIDLLKIDAEGYDPLVLKGARNLFAGHRLGVVQFEYNWRWIRQRQYLSDVFEFIAPWNYRIGKITCCGVEFYDAWQPELETLVENNYAIVRNDLASHISRVKPWFA